MGIALLAFAATLYPTQEVVVPQYTVRVLSIDGKAMRGIRVNQDWQEYSTQRDGRREILTTDDDGYVNFPARTLRGSFAGRFISLINIEKIGKGLKTSLPRLFDRL